MVDLLVDVKDQILVATKDKLPAVTMVKWKVLALECR
jgi:hypothetical protein